MAQLSWALRMNCETSVVCVAYLTMLCHCADRWYQMQCHSFSLCTLRRGMWMCSLNLYFLLRKLGLVALTSENSWNAVVSPQCFCLDEMWVLCSTVHVFRHWSQYMSGEALLQPLPKSAEKRARPEPNLCCMLIYAVHAWHGWEETEAGWAESAGCLHGNGQQPPGQQPAPGKSVTKQFLVMVLHLPCNSLADDACSTVLAWSPSLAWCGCLSDHSIPHLPTVSFLIWVISNPFKNTGTGGPAIFWVLPYSSLTMADGTSCCLLLACHR